MWTVFRPWVPAILNNNPEGCNQYTGPGCSVSSTKEPWQMTVEEFEKHSKTPQFGDWVMTKEGKIGKLQGSGGLGSDRVGVVGLDGVRTWHGRSETKLLQQSKNQNRHTESADEWLEQVSKKVSDLEDQNKELLFKKSLTDRFKKELRNGTISQGLYDGKIASGLLLDDDGYKKAESVTKQIEEAKNTPLTIKDNDIHRKIVESALQAGKKVPKKVLEAYPDLVTKKKGK